MKSKTKRALRNTLLTILVLVGIIFLIYFINLNKTIVADTITDFVSESPKDRTLINVTIITLIFVMLSLFIWVLIKLIKKR